MRVLIAYVTLSLVLQSLCLGELLEVEPCRLQAVPAEAPRRDRHTMLLAHFDDEASWNADYARADPTEVGVGQIIPVPGRFGKGAIVTDVTERKSVYSADGVQPDRLMYPGLDNLNFQKGTLEFWAQSSVQESIWSDGKEHWFVVLFPERSRMLARYGMSPHAIVLRKTTDDEFELKLMDERFAMYRSYESLTRTDKGSWLRLPVSKLDAAAWHHILISWDLRGEGRLWLTVDGVGVTASLGRDQDALPPNPGIYLFFGGFWQIPSECNLDELRVQECTVESRLPGAQPVPDRGIDEQRLLREEDLARKALDKILELQFKGGLANRYMWPNYAPGGWEFVGRGIDMWDANSAFAGDVLMRAWLLWGDDRYLDGAIDAADMFCKLQWENGSWAYHHTYSRGEFLPWGEAYIAQQMQTNQIRFLCLMYRLLGYERYENAVRKFGDWLIAIQHPEGAWGWHAYPEGTTAPYGNRALNDGVTTQVMSDLHVIWCATGDDKYLQPILKGVEWVIKAQAGPPTYGWADQYDKDFNRIWNRESEPPAISNGAINAAKNGLLLAYDLTGKDEFLDPLRRTLEWMASLPENKRGYLWYDPETGEPVDAQAYKMIPIVDPKGHDKNWHHRIRDALESRKNGPVYSDWRGDRRRAEFDDFPTVEDFVESFKSDRYSNVRENFAAWAVGKPGTNLVQTMGGTHGQPAYCLYGRVFDIGGLIDGCASLLSDSETARVGLGDIEPTAVPRYAHRAGNDTWVYMDPQRNFRRTPLAALP